MRFVYGVLIALLLAGCGYKPSSHMTRSLLGDRVYVEVHVDMVEPENAPYIQDALRKIVVQRFGASLVSKNQAQTRIDLHYSGSHIYPLTFQDGYVTRYRVVLPVRFDLMTPKGRYTKTITAIHEADVQVSTLQSNTLRIEAIQRAMQKALDEFVAYVAMQGVMKR